jgi:outer membrane protein
MRFAWILFLAVFCSALFSADNMKIGYIDFDKIMTASKDAQDAQRILDNDRQSWLSQGDEMKQEIARLKSEYDSRKMILSDAGKREAEQKIKDKEQELKDFLQDIFGDTGRLAEKNNELLAPIMDKVRQAVEKVADDNGFAMILTSDALVYAKTSLALDITDLVVDEMNKLGVEVNSPDTPSTPSAPQGGKQTGGSTSQTGSSKTGSGSSTSTGDTKTGSSGDTGGKK